ncbi:ALF repeat-containing protein [Lentzea californiensis]|uniref:ALF repeat-containing protein n=1 Tax=Lentzea californiensis TaxID=438851 RepID=UPI0021658EB5|nr:hypothetical protein [Lentzea californiensis]MCR3752385.1 Short repeat-containing protein of unknown function [Lentzea californiensis]
MNIKPTSAASLRRRSITAVIITVVLALLGSTAPAVAAPVRPVPLLQQAAPASDPDEVDEELEFYKQLVGDIRDHAEDVEVRDAAAAALAIGTKEKLLWFLDHGQAEAQARADQRKQVERVENRKKVEEWARTGGPNVKAGAQAALNAGDRAIADFVAFGYEIALKQDKQQAEDDKAEQDRIIARVRDMVAHGGPQVKVEGEAVLLLGDYAKIREFYLTGYHEAHRRDAEFQLVIEKALDDRNRALTELDKFARTAEAAAKARAEIMRANINAVKAMDDSIFAMQMAVKAAHKADKVFQEDKHGRANGQKGRDQELDALRAEAAEYAARGARVAEEADRINVGVHQVAVRLVETGQTNGLDWAKVTIGIASAVEAAALAAETSQHAAEATLADSRALDADRNAQEHANNARKYREEAERQSQRAVDLAAAAKVQHDIAIAARDRAEQQKNLAAQKANQAQQHAANARNARVNAQGAASNAISKSKVATDAYNNAVVHKTNMDKAVDKVGRLGKQVEVAEHVFGKRIQVYDQFARELEAARKKAEELGGDAWNEYRAIEGHTNAAKAAADQSAAWASNARAAAATARAEAQAATNAANQAQAAANRASQEAVTARRAADETHRLALETTNAAIASKNAAEKVQSEAEESVREANQAVYQSVVADRAASAAAASAELVIDPVRVAQDVLRPFAGVNADARKALQTVADALLISEEQSRAARDKAAEAAAAAIRARKAADQAVGDIKPAFEAAARAVEAANAAAQDAVEANDAANTAAQHAGTASGSAATAAKWASSARSDATMAGEAANAASNAAAAAGQAAAATENLRGIALNIAKGFDSFENMIVERLNQVTDIRQRFEEAKRIVAAEAEQRREELNRQAVGYITGAISCEISTYLPTCLAFKQKVNLKIYEGLAAAGNYAEDWIKCAGGDEPACKRTLDASIKIRDFAWEAVKGFGEAAISLPVTVFKVAECVANGVVNSNWAQCQTMLNGVEYMIKNPYTWINLDEWQTNPGKALGATLWDTATFVLTIEAGGIGGAAWKTARALTRKIDGGSGRASKGFADLESLAVKLHTSVRDKLPNSISEIFNLRAKFENGDAKFDGTSIAIVDGQLYRMEPFTLRPEGSPAIVDGSIVRLEGGSLRIENGVAKLDDARLKVEPPKNCVPGFAARAAASDCDSDPDPDKDDGSYEQTEGALKVKLSPQENNWANQQIEKANLLEKDITGDILGTAARTGGERYGKPEDVVKSPRSYKRKLFEELQPTDPNLPWDQRIAQIQDKMNDSVRYTITYDIGNYASQVLKALDDLGKKYELVVLKNGWRKRMSGDGVDSYPGINVTFKGPEGLLFEVQFHTLDAIGAKKKEDPNYQDRRAIRAAIKQVTDDPKLSAEEKRLQLARLEESQTELEEKAQEIWGAVKRPVGAVLIREYPNQLDE